MKRVSTVVVGVVAATACVTSGLTTTIAAAPAGAATSAHVWHRNIVSTTFWVGEIFSSGPNGSQVISTYDDKWQVHYGGCDGVVRNGKCSTERRVAANGYFPRHMKPKQNPFYLDVPFDDVNDPKGAAGRARAVPWAHLPQNRAILANPNRSLMKNHWVEIVDHGRVCYGQIEDAGPGQYHDARYVFGGGRPRNRLYNGAGMDVSPALNGCLGFKELNGDSDVVSWRFVSPKAVPPGPWRRLVTRT
jgi:hypothetical protein